MSEVSNFRVCVCVCVHKHVYQQKLSRQDLVVMGHPFSCEENSEGLVLWLRCVLVSLWTGSAWPGQGPGLQGGPWAPALALGPHSGPADSAAVRPCWALDSPAQQV